VINSAAKRMQLACRRFAPSGAWPRAFGPEAKERPTSLTRGRNNHNAQGLRPRDQQQPRWGILVVVNRERSLTFGRQSPTRGPHQIRTGRYVDRTPARAR